MRLSLLSVTALVGCVVGCNHSPEGGTTPTSNAGFKLSLPISAATKDVKQGETATFDGSVDRDSGFQKDVHLKVAGPDKLPVKLNKDTIKASEDTKFNITISPTKDTPLGEHIIKVTGTPDGGGSPTTGEFRVKVIDNK
jgi:uncharacterized membrane protein